MESATSAQRVHIVNPAVTEKDPLLPKHKDISKESPQQESISENSQELPVVIPGFWKRLVIKISAFFSLRDTSVFEGIASNFPSELSTGSIHPVVIDSFQVTIAKHKDLYQQKKALESTIEQLTSPEDADQLKVAQEQLTKAEAEFKKTSHTIKRAMGRGHVVQTKEGDIIIHPEVLKTHNFFKENAQRLQGALQDPQGFSKEEIMVLSSPLFLSERDKNNIALYHNTYNTGLVSSSPKEQKVQWPEDGIMGTQTSIPNNNRGRKPRNNNRSVDRSVVIDENPTRSRWDREAIPEKGILKR